MVPTPAIVRCSRGAYYETLWVPFVSVRAIRLGPQRLQRCPVHRRWEMTRIVPDGDLTPQVLREARTHLAGRVP